MRNRRSLKEANREKFIRDEISKNFSNAREMVLFRTKFIDKQTKDKTSLLSDDFPYNAGKESSVSTEKTLRYNIISDLETVKNILDIETEKITNNHRSYINAFNALENEFKTLENEANRNILLTLRDDPFSYGITETFQSYDMIDNERSTSQTLMDKITLGATSISPEDLPIKNVSTRFISRNGSITNVSELSDSYNIYKKDGSDFKVKVETSNNSTFVQLELLIELQTEVKIDKLAVVSRAIEANSTESISVFYSKDGVEYLRPELSSIDRMENLTNLFDIYDTDIKSLKIRFGKYSADISNVTSNQYIYSIDYIGKIDYLFNDESVFYSKGYEIVDEDENPVDFTMATLETGTCCVTPDETSISFFLSKDGENYLPASYFGEENTVVAFKNVIDRDVFTRIDNNTVNDLIEVDLNTWKINNYIQKNIIVNIDSLVIKRNFSKWILNNGRFETTISIENEEGRFFDVGPNTCKINEVEKSGRFFLPKGEHFVSVFSANYKTVIQRLQNISLLREADDLYPYNLKYVFQGYDYSNNFEGEKVYQGADSFFESRLKKVDKNYFENNPNDRDIFYVEDTNEGLFFYIHKGDRNSLEQIYLDCRINDDNIDNKIYVKAILKTNNVFKTPRIDSIQVRVI